MFLFKFWIISIIVKCATEFVNNQKNIKNCVKPSYFQKNNLT